MTFFLLQQHDDDVCIYIYIPSYDQFIIQYQLLLILN
jgi:hypothetical protein